MVATLLLFYGVPLLVPAVFLCTHGGRMTSRGFFYVLGVLISYGITFASAFVWGALCAIIAHVVGALSSSFEHGSEASRAIMFPTHMGMAWAILAPTGLGALISVAALRMFARRFYNVDLGATESIDAPESHPGPT
jgi:hypothetical protein